MRQIRIATRGSRLAMAQSEYIKSRLAEVAPGTDVVLVPISTRGDRDTSEFLYKSESVGFFTSEVEAALLDRRADVAVHSFKDLPTASTEGLLVAAVPRRESTADVVVARGKLQSVADLPEGATVGTSSLRRIGQLKHLRPDLNCVPLRGNVETRAAKVESGQIDAAILAEAGLRRLGLTDKISLVLDNRAFPTAPAQGALAVEIRADDATLARVVGQLDDPDTRTAAQAERGILAAMRGGCSIPLGVWSEIVDDIITLEATISDVDGRQCIRRGGSAQVRDAADLAIRVARELLEAGGRQILDRIRREKD
ncbi:MAG TPA: hydroxymethylbilane synthase [Anaerohalosphaeraceae bacterium]|jgi:hydroxymethylbilane synthase|nr:hydroxymethylbilane synthase [Anaerohalosphaeraceae bacterium]HRT51938.1 hydroxymethylbilane synthase [Anaerohalosphaeraceae bacterium]HRT88002.1 hydroxymethylbilane synthase [Anaerohalosphaeraceae bacterium]